MPADNAFLPTLIAATQTPWQPGTSGLNIQRSAEQLPSAFAVSELAAASVATASLAARRLQALLAPSANSDTPTVVDQRLASLWFGFTVVPIGWEIGSAWDEVAGIYQTTDGHVRLHTNAPHHRQAAIGVLGCADDRPGVTAAVATWNGIELQEAIYEAGGVAVALNRREQWAAHPQGTALNTEPLVHHQVDEAQAPQPQRHGAYVQTALDSGAERPLAGVRVLDLTRVLAGPVATRFLAGLGADVLRIDPPSWSEPGVIPEVTLGKRSARLDLRAETDRAVFTDLLATADILVHGYRPGALDGLGFGAERRRTRNPGLVDVSLNAWGHAGPWAGRRGFDSIVQIASGIAAAGAERYGTDGPKPLPVQALDHAAGYTLAACAINGWRLRLETHRGSTWKTSLAAHAELLCSQTQADPDTEFAPLGDADLAEHPETTSWGPARRVAAPVRDLLRWDTGAIDLGTTSSPAWR